MEFDLAYVNYSVWTGPKYPQNLIKQQGLILISKHPFHSITFVNSILHQVLKENQLRHFFSLVFYILFVW